MSTLLTCSNVSLSLLLCTRKNIKVSMMDKKKKERKKYSHRTGSDELEEVVVPASQRDAVCDVMRPARRSEARSSG
jgi:hypothetical protein